MTQERKTRLVARGGVLLSAALWLLIAVAAVQASPTAAPVNIDPPTITGTARVGEVADRTERHVGKQSDNVPVPLAAL